jgi:recombination protein RecR
MIDPLDRLTTLLARLPGLGEKSALRLALAVVEADGDYVAALADAIRSASTGMTECSICCDLASAEVCSVCADAKRDPTMICVVARPQDRMALERAAVFKGRYHILHGVLDPLADVNPGSLRLRELLDRLRDAKVREVIVATSPTVEGDATALYLAHVLRPCGVVVSRIASGVAVGGDLEYADMSTLHRALVDRRTIEESPGDASG